MKRYVLVLLVSILSSGIYAQHKSDRKIRKQEKIAREYAAIKELISTNQFEFEATWAIPQRGTRINLITNRGFFELDNETLTFFFPYFGETHISTTNSGRISYDYTGSWENYTVTHNNEKHHSIIKGNTLYKNERLEFILKVSASGLATFSITSSHRERIRYEGEFKALSDATSK